MTEYKSFTVIPSWDRYIDLQKCTTCGALVADKELHSEWHEKLRWSKAGRKPLRG